MSSTNRSNARSKHNFDYYVTPLKWVRQFLWQFVENEWLNLSNMHILDPCAWGDVTHPMSYPTVLLENGAKDITTLDMCMAKMI